MALAAKDIPSSWDVTSDSLAAWLAGRLAARRLILVKHVLLEEDAISSRDLAARSIVDEAFGGFLQASGADATIAGPADHAALAAALDRGGAVGTRVD
jgi:dihydroneopterin aldolase